MTPSSPTSPGSSSGPATEHCPDPIFIVGSERSGSNLLRLILSAHPSICIPHPPHILRDFHPWVGYYGDLSDDSRFDRLICDVLESVRRHFAPWSWIPEAGRVRSEAPSRSLYGIYAAIHELVRRHEGKPRWGCKSTFMVNHLKDIELHHRHPKVLHLVRDPRDVAASAADSIFSEYHPARTARRWKREQETALRFADRDGAIARGLMLQIHYESLTKNPESECRRIMTFLGETFLPEQLRFFETPVAKDLSRLNRSWKNCARPVSGKSVQSFRHKLSEEAIRDVERECAGTMRTLGYVPIFETIERPMNPGKQIRVDFEDRWTKLRAEATSLVRDPNTRLRWKKSAFLRWTRWKRSLGFGFSSRCPDPDAR